MDSVTADLRVMGVKRMEEHGSWQREMERHCPRGQSSSRVVASVKKKKNRLYDYNI
jgi:hypothetical protein